MDVKIGYKQTEVGVIPSDWEVSLLVEVVNYLHGKAHERNIVEDGRYTVVNSKFVASEGRVAKYSDYNYCQARKDDILTVLSDLPNGKALAKCYFVSQDDKYAVNQRVCIWRSKKPVPKFLFYLLNRHKYFLALDDGLSQTHILNHHIEKCKIPLPPTLTEQTAIATALTDADNYIQSLEKLIAKKRLIKQGAMQELLKPKEGWVVKKLGDVGECIIGLTYNPANVSESGTLVLRSSNIQENTLRFDDNVYVDSEIPEKLFNKENDILICVRNGSRDLIGKSALIKGRAVGETFGAFMTIYRSQYNKYIFCLFQSKAIKDQINEHLGATINQITNKSLNAFQIYLPTMNEQIRITAILSDMDNEIQTLALQLEKAKQIKQGMMQELLTGKTRLV